MLIDANLLIYSVDRASPFHESAANWFSEALSGDHRVGLPWQSIGAFLRIMTHPRITTDPLSGHQAWDHVQSWLSTDPVWIPPADTATARVYGALVQETPVTANLVPDAQLAALAIQYGLVIYSADTDFARFTGLRWINPLS